MESYDPKEAIRLCTKAIELNPCCVDALVMLAAVFDDLDKHTPSATVSKAHSVSAHRFSPLETVAQQQYVRLAYVRRSKGDAGIPVCRVMWGQVARPFNR